MQYRINAWLQVVIWVFALIIGGITIAATGSPAGTNRTVIILLLLPMVVALFIAAINLSMTVLYIASDEISLRSFVRNTTLSAADIKGYRLIKTSKNARLVFIPSDKTAKSISIAVDNFKNSKDIIDYAKTNFADIDKLVYEEELNEMLQDESLGASAEERKSFLAIRKKLAIALNILGVASTFVLFFIKDLPVIWRTLPLLFSLLALVLVSISRGVVLLIGRARSPRPSVLLAFVLPPVFFLIYTVSTHRFYNLQDFWLQWLKWSAIIFVAVALLFFGLIKSKRENGVIFLLIGVVVVSAAGGLIFFNSYLDTAKPSIYHAGVVNKWKQRGKSTSYYLSLSEWGKYIHGDKESVSSSLYNEVNVGDTVKILVHTGKYNIPWYTVDADNAQIGKINAP